MVAFTGAEPVRAGRRGEIDYRLAARLDDELEVTARPEKLGAATVAFGQEIRRGDDGELLAGARVEVACLTADTFRATRMPGWLRQKIAGDMDE